MSCRTSSRRAGNAARAHGHTRHNPAPALETGQDGRPANGRPREPRRPAPAGTKEIRRSDHGPLAKWLGSAHVQHMNAFRSRVGSIDWVDLSTPDADGGCAFYAKVLGWTFERSETPMGVYHVASVGGHQAGGVMVGGPPNGAPPMWTVFVRVADIDETSGAVANANGSILAGPFDIPGGAKVAMVADPTGAVFSLIAGGPEPDEGEPPLMRPVAGAVAWCEVVTRDPHTAVSFYDAAFGWQAHLDGTSGYTTFRLGDADVAGILDANGSARRGSGALARLLQLPGYRRNASCRGRSRRFGDETSDHRRLRDLRRCGRPRERDVRPVCHGPDGVNGAAPGSSGNLLAA